MLGTQQEGRERGGGGKQGQQDWGIEREEEAAEGERGGRRGWRRGRKPSSKAKTKRGTRKEKKS